MTRDQIETVIFEQLDYLLHLNISTNNFICTTIVDKLLEEGLEVDEEFACLKDRKYD